MGSRSAPIGTPTSGVLSGDFSDLLLFWPASRFGADSQVDLLRKHAPDLKIRVINVVNLMKLQPSSEHAHGLTDHEFDALFTTDKPIMFAFHGYPSLIHRLTYRRNGHQNIHVRGYKEEGTTTTP